jgi:hypothetical protein
MTAFALCGRRREGNAEMRILPKKRSTKPGKRVRGYAIHVFRGAGYHPPSYTTPLLWKETPPVQEWQSVINDPTIQQAWMIESGRKMKEFQYTNTRRYRT